MSERRIGIGLIGVGGYGRQHLRAIARAEEQGLARLVAVVILPGMDTETEAALRARGVLIYRSHRELLARARGDAPGGLDLVGVPCGIDQHAPLSIDALEAGYNVLCEKPAAGNLGDARRMRDTAHRVGKVLSIGFQGMYTPAIRRIKEYALEGRVGGPLGRLLHAKTVIVWPRDSAYYGRNTWAGRLAVDGRSIYDSPVQNAAAHDLQSMLYVAGAGPDVSATPSGLYGENYRAKAIESADTQYVRVRTQEGPTLTFMATHACRDSSGPIAEYLFERGRIRWVGPARGGTVVMRRRDDGMVETIETLDNGMDEILHLPYVGVVRALLEGTPPAATIDNCIQHSVCVDALFGACGVVPVDPAYTHSEEAQTVVTSIPGIESLLGRMFETGQSFHEAGAPWARPGRDADLRDVGL